MPLDRDVFSRICRNFEDGIIHLEDAGILIEELRRMREKDNLLIRDAVEMWNEEKCRKDSSPDFHKLVAIVARIIDRPLDTLHHAPMCPANHWCQTTIPRGPCTCGAVRAAQ